MARFKNDTGNAITVIDLGRQVGPLEVFDWPGYDPVVHGPVAGCTRLDDPNDGKRKRKDAGAGQDVEDPA